MSDVHSRLLGLINNREARVAVIGLGYAGLPLARALVGAGFPVLGFDADRDKVARLRRGESTLGHVPGGALAAMLRRGFEATHAPDRLAAADAVLICVPTPLTGLRGPDLTCVKDAARAVADRLRPGQLVVLESTTFPGTTRRVVQPLLERTGLRAGEEFFLAYSPEREDPANPAFSLANVPKVVGAADRVSLEAAAALYAKVAPRVVPVSSPEAAEACKVLENTYRAVNIALVNELKVLFDRMGIDVWEVIEAARTKPFGFQAFYPGPGLGGACVPVAPLYLTWAARKHGLETRFIELAAEVNGAMPAYAAARLADALKERGKSLQGGRVMVLGLAYKRDVGDCRGSPGLALMGLLIREGAAVSYNDPHVPRLAAPDLPHSATLSQPLTPDALAGQDAVVVVTDHSAYDWAFVVEHARLVIDTRNATRGVAAHREKVVRA
jgi:UDP-N-acetyl-D-glucosamine dehydrogenase